MKKNNNFEPDRLQHNLKQLRLIEIAANYHQWAADAAKDNLTHLQFLEKIIRLEADAKMDRALKRRITSAKFPVIKTLEQFNWPLRHGKDPSGNCISLPRMLPGCTRLFSLCCTNYQCPRFGTQHRTTSQRNEKIYFP